jgi:uncharacterized protein
LKSRMRRKAGHFPGCFPLEKLDAIRSVRDFDETYTAPHFGFRNASDYYHRASAMRVIDRICVPGLIITAEDDPFVPSLPFRDPRVQANRSLRVIVSRYGGHCAFVTDAVDGTDGYWAEQQIMQFALANTAVTAPAAPSAASRSQAPDPALRA